MVFDLPESPIIKTLVINGRLSFLNDTNLHLQAEHIFVRSGEFFVGYKDKPFSAQAKITLHGERQSDTIVFTSAIEAGNRILVNIANVEMYGAARSGHSRLHSEANKGSTSFKVAPGLDWRGGDLIALAPTSFSEKNGEEAKLVSYDSITGDVVVEQPLLWFHWGRAVSTIAEYDADIRGEVVLLSRNILITGNECQVLTSDYIEGDLSVRSGRTILDQVEISHCSQENTHNAALRF